MTDKMPTKRAFSPTLRHHCFNTARVLATVLALGSLAASPLIVSSSASAAPGGFHMQGDAPYFHGHKGSHQHHHGWMQAHGWWFPPEAFHEEHHHHVQHTPEPPKPMGHPEVHHHDPHPGEPGPHLRTNHPAPFH